MAVVGRTHVHALADIDDAGSSLEDTNELMSSEEGSDIQTSANGEDDGGTNGEDEDGVQGNANAGWAQAMAKILGKQTPMKKPTILAKNTEIDNVKAKERQEQLERRNQIDKKRKWEMMCREKPNLVTDREAERALQRIATRGVVQLFNAVRSHQKNVDDKVKKEAGGSERKKAKILSSISKKDFIDVLRKTEGGSSITVKEEKNSAPDVEEKPAWSVLRDDYMMGATMKDWDKHSDEEAAHAGRGSDENDSD
ncbi:RRP15-like protein [Dunckerocampus dactyliophorus]|uniref:RRP15-like protein n=1 Tax=Dunckerocampus dactyliophorus TaxID=161453 RepID=UPI0024054199|nr:RRP15-like protein [Dunckerocampus dactyliophorus]